MSHWHSNEQISPWHNHASNTANYSSATGVDHPALCEELRNKVQFSIPQAFIVQGCCSGVRAPRGQCTADINIGKLKTIVARAGTSEKDVYEPLNGSSQYVSHNAIDGPKRMFERQIGLQSDPSADPNVEPHTSDEFSPILHRFLWRTVSKPMWEYTSDLELLKGYLAALKAHEAFKNSGIFHRDINADSILLATDSAKVKPGEEGFLIDFEFASVPLVNEQESVSTRSGWTIRPTDRSGAPIKGTVQFMAIALLAAITNKADSIKHTPEHDLESFIWVFVYCVLRKLAHTADSSSMDLKRIASEFLKESFGKSKVSDILADRSSVAAFTWTHRETKSPEWATFVRSNISPAILKLFDVFANRLMALQLDGQRLASAPDVFKAKDVVVTGVNTLTHGLLDELIREGIATLEAGAAP